MKGVTQQNEDQTDSNHAQMEHANTEQPTQMKSNHAELMKTPMWVVSKVQCTHGWINLLWFIQINEKNSRYPQFTWYL